MAYILPRLSKGGAWSGTWCAKAGK
jgi:hypothetical protein